MNRRRPARRLLSYCIRLARQFIPCLPRKKFRQAQQINSVWGMGK